MRIDVINRKITTLDRSVKARVMVPDGYDSSDKCYPVLYINDGQDVFRDQDVFWNGESLRFEQYYKDYGKFLPEVILVAIESPDINAVRTAQYSPYTKDFNVPPEKKFESHIEGKGVAYLDWLTTDFKEMIDKCYRTRPEQEYTGICGYSTGGLNCIYAGLQYPHIFSRLIAMSSAVYIWMDKLEETMKSADYSHLKYVYVDVGTNEFGRMTTKEEFLEGADIIYDYLKKNHLSDRQLKYNIYPDAIHHQKEWRVRFPDALRWVFQDI
ncbi:alpha/beta hydrolase-fold protein [Petroclostridium sp. X23]|uniref:alpha/beta hydrolase n=1 Tax=Petroclostridium sp. X23 TaxID=3045146 RepID=UPI0024AD4E2D|nr:alpha/beta hydrolase-fold protein [Petroclostridium sp. X23]WHH59088.1 alpha/beta hydrolase-fold protein [Petroclostridium sp. X23]